MGINLSERAVECSALHWGAGDRGATGDSQHCWGIDECSLSLHCQGLTCWEPVGHSSLPTLLRAHPGAPEDRSVPQSPKIVLLNYLPFGMAALLLGASVLSLIGSITLIYGWVSVGVHSE